MDLMDLIKSKWEISNGHIVSVTAHSLHLYNAHRAVIFAIAQLSCNSKVITFTHLFTADDARAAPPRRAPPPNLPIVSTQSLKQFNRFDARSRTTSSY